MPREKIRRLVIAGPTGIGKTAISLELARTLKTNFSRGISIISADSRQCYKHLDIGTGKVTPEEMGDIPHFNISLLNPDESDTAAAFAKRAKIWEDQIHESGRFPIVAGGSTLHLQSLIWPLDDIPGACVYNQIQLREKEEKEGSDFLMRWLARVDPDYVKKMDGYNRHRVYRALDVFMQTGEPFSRFHNEQNLRETPSDTMLIVLTSDRKEQVEKIERRVEAMIDLGLVQETRNVLEMGYPESVQSLQTVGYKEAIEFIKGEIDVKEMTSRIKTNTRQYAKRQATWFRRWKSARFVDVSGKQPEEIASQIANMAKPLFLMDGESKYR